MKKKIILICILLIITSCVNQYEYNYLEQIIDNRNILVSQQHNIMKNQEIIEEHLIVINNNLKSMTENQQKIINVCIK